MIKGILKGILIVFLGLSAVLVVKNVGKPRKPTTTSEAAATVALTIFLMACVVLA